MSINIRLDVPALDRLIGGDSEIEIELRRGVVEAFTKQKLHGLLKDADIKKLHDEVLRSVTEIRTAVLAKVAETVQAEIGTVKRDNWSKQITSITLSPEYKAVLETEAKRLAEAEFAAVALGPMQAYVDQRIDKMEERMAARVDAALARIIDANFEQRVQAQVQARITAAAQQFVARTVPPAAAPTTLAGG